MTYFGFLGIFIGIPLLILWYLHRRDLRQGRRLPAALSAWPPTFIIATHVVVALLYTTPWDNYLVATSVWWYDPQLVTGIVLGWVPIEEYSFFVLQTILTGMWLVYLARRVEHGAPEAIQHAQPGTGRVLRQTSALVVAVIWLGSVVLLASEWRPGVYLGLEIVWALPPIILQLAFGADILWRRRRLIFWALIPATLYLCIADAIAIGSGTWTIDPAQSTGIMLGVLPVEEAVFFLLTNTLIVFGATLMLAQESQPRAPQVVLNWMSRISMQSDQTNTRQKGLSNV